MSREERSSRGLEVPMDVVGFLGAVGSSTPEDRALPKQFLREAYVTGLEPPQFTERSGRFGVSPGEWDSRTEHCLMFLRPEDVQASSAFCLAPVGAGSFCVAASLGGGSCAVNSHSSKMELRPGWYVRNVASMAAMQSASTVAGSSRRRHAFVEPWIPPLAETLREPVRSALLHPESPFTLSLGQWKYVAGELTDWSGERMPETIEPLRSDSSSGVLVEGSEDIELARLEREAEVLRTIQEPSSPHDSEISLGTPPESEVRTDEQEAVHAVLRGMLEQDLASYREDVRQLSDKVRELEKVRELSTKVQDLETRNQRYRSLIERSLSIAASLQERVETIESSRPVQSGVGHADVARLEGRLRRVESSCLSPDGVLDEVRRDLRDLQDQVERGGVHFDEFHWASSREFLAWYGTRDPGSAVSFGLFVDAFSLLHNLSSGTVEMKDSLASEHAIKKVEYKNPLEARASTSYASDYPDVFGPSGMGDNFGKSLANFDAWKNDRDRSGLSFVIRQELDSHTRSILAAIQDEIGADDLRRLAKEMLSKASAWVLSYLKFGEEFYSEMSRAAAMTEAEAWSLTKSLLGEVLWQIRVARNLVKTLKEGNRTLHIWGALKAQEVMHQFDEKEFRDHAALAGLQLRFIMKRKSDIDGFDRLSTRLHGLENKSNVLTQKADALTRELAKKADK